MTELSDTTMNAASVSTTGQPKKRNGGSALRRRLSSHPPKKSGHSTCQLAESHSSRATSRRMFGNRSTCLTRSANSNVRLAVMPDEDLKIVHPAHTVTGIAANRQSSDHADRLRRRPARADHTTSRPRSIPNAMTPSFLIHMPKAAIQEATNRSPSDDVRTYRQRNTAAPRLV